MENLALVINERLRQISEGWSKDHDAKHESGELVLLACCYALNTYTVNDKLKKTISSELDAYWGEGDFNKPVDPVDNLAKAGALILAELDRVNSSVGEKYVLTGRYE